MNSHIPVETDLESTTLIEMAAPDIELLSQYDFTAEQIDSLLELRQRYQHGGSDRASVIHPLEFLKYLVMSGRMEK